MSVTHSRLVTSVAHAVHNWAHPSCQIRHTIPPFFFLTYGPSSTLHQVDKLIETMKPNGITIATDGWSSNKDKRAFHNFLYCSGGLCLFVDAEDVTSSSQTAVNIAASLMKHINILGPSNVTAVAMDNISANEAAMDIIRATPGCERKRGPP